MSRVRGLAALLLVCILLMPAPVMAEPVEPPLIAGVPIDFILFALTLVGIALQNAFVNPPFAFSAVFNASGAAVPTLQNPQSGAQRKTQGALEGAGQKIRDLVSGDDDDEERQPSRRSRRGED